MRGWFEKNGKTMTSDSATNFRFGIAATQQDIFLNKTFGYNGQIVTVQHIYSGMSFRAQRPAPVRVKIFPTHSRFLVAVARRNDKPLMSYVKPSIN